MPDHVRDTLADRPREQLPQLGRHLFGAVGQVGLDVGGAERLPRAGELAGERQVAVALDGPPHVGERVTAQPLEVGSSSARARSGSMSSSRFASSALTVMTVNE